MCVLIKGDENMKTPNWIDENWAEGLSKLEYNYATGIFKDTYWRKLVGYRKWIREEITDEERLDKTYYSKGENLKPIRLMEWRPIYVNLLETRFVNKGKGAWKIFNNPHNKESKENYVEMFEWHGHGCFCCDTEMWEKQNDKNFKRKMINHADSI